NLVSNQSAPTFDHYFELNELKAQSLEKDTVISKLKERIKSVSGQMKEDKIKKKLKEIETINIELDHWVSKLVAENEHLKQTYKQLYDSIKSTPLKDALRKLKGKALVDDAVTSHSIAPKMINVDVEPLNPRLLNNRSKPSTSASGSQPSGITKKDKIQRPPSSTQKNKVEAHPKTVKSSLKNKNCVVEPKRTVFVQRSKLNVNSELKCVMCNGCMITTTTKMTFRKPITVETNTPKPVATMVYSRRPRKSKSTDLVSKSKVIQSVHANKKEPIKSWGSTVSNIPSSSRDECSSGPVLHEMTPATISLGIVPNPPSSTPFVPPLRTDWDMYFQPLFDELFTPPPSVENPAPEVITLIVEVVAPELTVSTNSPSSTTVDQDAPSPSHSQTTPETRSPIIPNDVEEDNHDLDITYMNNDSFFDADHAGCQDTCRSTSGSLQFLGERLISWSSKGEKVLRYPVRKLNISPYLAVVLKFYG
nr:retrovirus-related like polyprotein [Tanacetum cinerariifolium]